MFTGLVKAVGQLHRCPPGVRVRLESPLACDALQLGDSVAVDGVCLTVAELTRDGFRADVSEESLRRSTLGEKAARGAWVNLEPALRLSDRLGGHLVSGHVDGLGTVRGVAMEAGSWRLDLAWDNPSYGRYICEKASIAVDGVSLTVAGCDATGGGFWIAVIPHTWTSTTLRQLRAGDGVNLEADLLAKYTERLLREGFHRAGGTRDAHPRPREDPRTITAEWLNRQGWPGG